MKACTQALNQNTELSEYDAIGVNIAAKLKRMESKQSIYADFLINKILTKGLLGTLNSSIDIYDPVKNTTQNNDDIYYTNFQNTVPVTVEDQINYDSQRPTPLPILFDYNSSHSNTTSSVYDRSQPSTYISDSSVNNSPN